MSPSSSRRAARLSAIAAGVVIAAVFVGPANAQTRRIGISVGRISSEKSCTLYQESSGSSAMVATRHMVAAVESWRTWLVRDCVNDFSTIRTSVEAALASSGKFAIRPKGGSYSISGAISQVGSDSPGGFSSTNGGYDISTAGIFVSMNVIVRDAGGRVVYGGPLTKHLETSSISQTSDLSAASGMSGQGVYTVLQNQMALAVARLVAFHIDPLRVVSGGGRQIRLNYGSPLLTLGTVVHATGSNGVMVRYLVSSADPDGATADIDSEADSSQVGPGSAVTAIESGDPAANERRIQRVDLPG